MRYLNALGEIPEHLIGMYDIVQLRLFQVVVKDNDPGPLLRNMLKMLSGCSSFAFVLHCMHLPSMGSAYSRDSEKLDLLYMPEEGF